MNDFELEMWRAYEREKRKLEDLSPWQYEREIKALADRLCL